MNKLNETVEELINLRNQIRKLGTSSKESSLPKEKIFQLSDQLRDVTFPKLGITIKVLIFFFFLSSVK